MALAFLETTLVVFLFLAPLLWRSSRTFKYYVKVTFYFVYMMLSGLLAFFVVVWRPMHPNNIIFVRDMWNYCLSIYQWRCEVRHRERGDYMKPAIIVCNHQSAMDMIAMMAAMPERTTALAKKELLYAGFWGLAAYFCGLIFVDRLNPDKAKDTMTRAVKYLQDSNMKCWIFAEGTRRLDGKIHPFKKGGFHLAVQGQMPVIPIVVSSYLPFFDSKKKLFEPGKIIVTFLPHVSTEGLSSDDVSDLTEKVHRQMEQVFNETSQEVADLMQSSSSAH